jgi:Lytic transglycolase
MTAAHRTLPLGTKVTVFKHGNGRSAVVRINDRGPFVHGRVIDLSPGGGTGVGRRRVSVSHTDRGKSCFKPIAQRLEWLKGRVAWSTKRAGAGIRQVIRPLKCRATLRSRSSTGLRPVLVSTIRILAKLPKLFRSHCRNGRIWIYRKTDAFVRGQILRAADRHRSMSSVWVSNFVQTPSVNRRMESRG